jgi:hypothetical protein
LAESQLLKDLLSLSTRTPKGKKALSHTLS